MAQSKKCKQMHAEQLAAAQEMFELYTKFIIEEFVSKFGKSYETSKYFLEKEKEKRESRKDKNASKESKKIDTWQAHYDYKPECEEFLIDKTKTFIHIGPSVDRKYQSPTFLRNLTSLISEYLSSYIAKKGLDRNECTKYLQGILFNNNRHVQLETERYVSQNNREWGLKQKEKHQQQEAKKQPNKRKRINHTKGKPVEMSEKERAELQEQSLRYRIEEKRKELGMEPRTFSPEEEQVFHHKMEEYSKFKRGQQINIIISINEIKR